MNIVFSMNRSGMEGLGATLSSLLQHCSDSAQLDLHFLCCSIGNDEKRDIEYLAKWNHFKGRVHFIDYHAKKHFGHLRSLHGDWTPYGILLIPHLIPSEKALYLDTDLIITADVLELNELEQDGFPMAAVPSGPANMSRDKDLYLDTLGFQSDLQVFNSGVLLFNLEAWKDQGIDQKCEAFTERYAKRLLSADQTLLNAVFAGNYAPLPERFNRRWTVMDDEIRDPDNSILHFVGSPKPWDLLGKATHKGHRLWTAYNPAFWAKKYNQFSSEKLYRTWKIKKSIIRAIVKEYLK